MTEQDKQALIKHFCSRDCGEAAKDCTIMPCHEIELIQEFHTTEADSDTISRAKAIEALYHVDEYNGRSVEAIRKLPPAQPERKLQKLAEEIAAFKRSIKSENGDYLTGYLCALSAVEGMIADMREVTT